MSARLIMNGRGLLLNLLSVYSGLAQEFALSQFRSPAYNFNVSVTRSENITLAADLNRAAANN
jgi:hypothetical protein